MRDFPFILKILRIFIETHKNFGHVNKVNNWIYLFCKGFHVFIIVLT